MDILIKDMKVPKYCFEDDGGMIAVCPFLDICRRKWGVNINASNIHSKCCPLIPVPEHGDLIDRDSVATAMRDYLLNHFGERLDEDLSNAIYALIAESAVLERTT